MQPTNWLILNKYPFELIPGEGRNMEGGGVSYYDYINKRPTETGKNVQCIATLIKDLPKGLSVWEQAHIIHEIDETCLLQLEHSLSKYNVAIDKQDATKVLGTQYADVFMVDFPLFSMLRYLKGRWEPELRRMTLQRPQAIIMTDGSSCRYHLQWKNYKKVDSRIDETRSSYVYALSRLFHERYGYSIVACAFHANSFYYRLENVKPNQAQFINFPAGSSKDGLRRVK
jgi:hypothetical protein